LLRKVQSFTRRRDAPPENNIMSYTKTIAVSELPEGTQKTVTLAGQDVALFHHGGKITALCGTCPHEGGPLAEGNVERGADGVLRVVCPWHGWQFDIARVITAIPSPPAPGPVRFRSRMPRTG
jgi:nitrite reductase/ring-hydroxylating ferredoxin subunit